MGKVRDFLRGVGILSSAGITVSNAGTRLLDLRNDLNSLAKSGARGNEKPVASERLASYTRAAAPRGTARSRAAQPKKMTARSRAASPRRTAAKRGPAAAPARRKPASSKLSAAQLEHKRKYNRERMRRIRAKKRA